MELRQPRGEHYFPTSFILRSLVWSEWRHGVASVQVSESFGRRQHDPSGMKSLKTCCSLQSLEARWVLCASVSLAVRKRCYQTFMDGKCFLYTKLCYCKLGLMNRRNCIAWIAFCTLKQWGTLIPLHYERVFVYPSSSSAEGFHFTGNCRYT